MCIRDRFVEKHFEGIKDAAEALVGVGTILLGLHIAEMFVSWGTEAAAATYRLAAAGIAMWENVGAAAALKTSFAAIGFTPIGLAITGVTLALYGLYRALDQVKGSGHTWGDVVHGIVQNIVDMGNGSAKGFGAAIDGATKARQAVEKLNDIMLKVTQTQQVYNTEAEAWAAAAGHAIAPNTPTNTGATPAEKGKEAQALMQERMEQAKVELDAKKRGIADEKEVDDERYKYEQESLELHYANMRKIAQENRDATKDEAKAAFDATMAELDEQKKDQGMKQAVYQAKELTAVMKYNLSLIHI